MEHKNNKSMLISNKSKVVYLKRQGSRPKEWIETYCVQKLSQSINLTKSCKMQLNLGKGIQTH